jgi:Xaa-Pro dipeptidase
MKGTIILPGPNMQYYFDLKTKSFERFSAALISSDDSDYGVILPALDASKVKKSRCIKSDNIFTYTDSEGPERILKRCLSELGLKNAKLGVEETFPLKMMQTFQRVAPKTEFTDVTKLISQMRIVKAPSELDAIRKSSEILERSIQAGVELIRPGSSEDEVGLEIKNTALRGGADSIDFCAVQSGKNSAIPHSETSRKKFEKGDIVVCDVSCTYDGYFADITRTFLVGRKPNQKQRKIYEIVLKAQKTGIDALEAHVSCESVDVKTRMVIEEAGYGEFFIHRTGHGLGVEVHEPPFLRTGNRERLGYNMVLTVEPGIYLPGEFGVRIEDNLVINEDGAENITSMQKEELEVLP